MVSQRKRGILKQKGNDMSIGELENMINEYKELENELQELKDMCDDITKIKVKKLEREIIDGDYDKRWIMLMEMQNTMHVSMTFSTDRCFFSASKNFTYSIGGYLDRRVTMTISDNQIIYKSDKINVDERLFILDRFMACIEYYENEVLKLYKEKTEKLFQSIEDMKEKIQNA